jgi:hypothetical protein
MKIFDDDERKARQQIPDGFGPVREGPIFPDDLVYSWPGGGFLPADSAEWNSRLPADASDCVLVIRRGSLPAMFANTERRTYKIKRFIEPSTTPDSASQKSLF